jgi:hypothetical protein
MVYATQRKSPHFLQGEELDIQLHLSICGVLVPRSQWLSLFMDVQTPYIKWCVIILQIISRLFTIAHIM